MKLFKKSFIAALIMSVLALSGCGDTEPRISAPEASGRFSVTVLKAGQADAMILKTENHSIIIDTGEKDDGDELCACLDENGITGIDYLFITHYDKDHVGGFPELADYAGIENILVPDYEGTSDEYAAFLKSAEENGLTVTRLTADTSLVIDDTLFEVSVPKKKFYKEGDNDYSLVISVTHGENTFLFAGDAEKERLSEVLSEFPRQFDFLKVPHHGKYNGNTKRFINTVKPKYAVICDSEKNPASDKTVSLLKSQNAELYSTKDGDITAVSDGKKIIINQ